MLPSQDKDPGAGELHDISTWPVHTDLRGELDKLVEEYSVRDFPVYDTDHNRVDPVHIQAKMKGALVECSFRLLHYNFGGPDDSFVGEIVQVVILRPKAQQPPSPYKSSPNKPYRPAALSAAEIHAEQQRAVGFFTPPIVMPPAGPSNLAAPTPIVDDLQKPAESDKRPATAAMEQANGGLADASLAEILLPSKSSAGSHAYLAHLTSLSLPTLLSEPAALQTQSHHLTSSLTSLTHTSYPTFLSLHQTTSSLSTSLASLESSLGNLLTASLPALEDCAAGWRERTEKVLVDRRKARVVLEQHDKIRDLLEIPMLIDTCVRNGYFAEALSLASRARSLFVGSSTPPLILTSILSEVQNCITQMLLSLLATLHEPNRKLPALWKAVNFLRKMDMFGSSSEEGEQSEEQIALVFLGGREGCLKASLESTSRDILRLIGSSGLGEREKEDMTKFLKKYIDVWREGVYDIITQFSAIFLERPPSNTPITPSTTSQPILTLHPLLTTYTTHALTTHLLPLLSQTLPLLPISTLPSLLTQLTYCATAFARVGMDFRGVLGGLFCTAVAGAVSGEIKAASAKWVDRVKNALGDALPLSPTLSSNSNIQRKVKMTPPSQWIIVSSLVTSPPAPSTSSPPGPAHVPPQILASYPPIAEYTNTLLGILNGLRLLAPVEILSELVIVLDGALNEGGDALLAYVRRVCDNGKEQDDKVVLAAGEVYFGVFVPFMRRALVEGVYGVPIFSREDAEAGYRIGIHFHYSRSAGLVRARVLAVGSFAGALFFQSSTFLGDSDRSSPDDALYSPHPYFLLAFFAIQVVWQLYWCMQLFSLKLDESTPALLSPADEEEARNVNGLMITPAPGPSKHRWLGWTVAWDFEHYILCQVLVTLNAASQLYFVLYVIHNSGNYAWSRRNQLTHLVAKANAGMSVLYVWKTWGVVQTGSKPHPSIMQKVHCGIVFLLLVFASGPDPTLGICLLFDLAALEAGNTKEEWKFTFICTAGILSVVIICDSYLAWKNRHTAHTYDHLRAEDDGFAIHSPEEIWMSYLPEDSGRA
ncbi:Dor1-like family-domain-containing protein [Mycena sp. CBHHK59/15]|nr:Dor1-like family-domain-containing protein [Mycena sp. CBHHK59/15]